MKHTLRLTYNQSTSILFNVVLVYIIRRDPDLIQSGVKHHNPSL